MSLTPILAPALAAEPLVRAGIGHAFFTRQGGVSTGLYARLNGGLGSRDDREAVIENRRRMAETLGLAPDRLLIPHLYHSPDCVTVDRPFDDASRPRCDALATRSPGLALGVTGADCGMILLADPLARVIGAAHAGWKGALTGVLESTLAAMVMLGADKGAVTAVLGPTIGPRSYEVGPEFIARFVDAAADHARFFGPAAQPGHAMFDLPAFIGFRLRRAGVGHFENLGLDTYADEDRFFSFRRATHRAEADYGRLVAAIVLR